MRQEEHTIIHAYPIRQLGADSLVHVRILDHTSSRHVLEQLWARRVSKNTFEVLSVPFFASGIAPGDIVRAEAEAGIDHVVVRAVENASGHLVFRVWFGNPPSPTIRLELLNEVQRLGCPVEWSSQHLLAIDAPPQTAEAVGSLLRARHLAGHLSYEVDASDPVQRDWPGSAFQARFSTETRRCGLAEGMERPCVPALSPRRSTGTTPTSPHGSEGDTSSAVVCPHCHVPVPAEYLADRPPANLAGEWPPREAEDQDETS
jgi:hypothetical protein